MDTNSWCTGGRWAVVRHAGEEEEEGCVHKSIVVKYFLSFCIFVSINLYSSPGNWISCCRMRRTVGSATMNSVMLDMCTICI